MGLAMNEPLDTKKKAEERKDLWKPQRSHFNDEEGNKDISVSIAKTLHS